MLQFFSPNILDRLQSHYGTADWTKWNLWRQPRYDFIRYAGAGTVQMQFMAVPIGGVDPVSLLGKTEEQTNLEKSRSFGEELYIITQIRTYIHVLPKPRQPVGINNDADVLFSSGMSLLANVLKDLSDQGVLHLRFQDKLFYTIEQPFKFAPPGLGIEIDQHAASLTKALWFQQSNDQQEVFMLDPQQWVEANQTINLTIDFPNGASPSIASLVNETTPSVNIGVWFDGYKVAPLQ